MNKQRRRAIDAVYAKLEELVEELEAIKDEEQEAFEKLPESLQDSVKGEAMNNAINNLDDAICYITDGIESLGEAME